jgi:hypothetical protein
MALCRVVVEARPEICELCGLYSALLLTRRPACQMLLELITQPLVGSQCTLEVSVLKRSVSVVCSIRAGARRATSACEASSCIDSAS